MPKGPEEAPVYSLSVERTFPETADWTNLLAAERRLTGTAGAEPSCGTDVPAYLRAEWIFSAEASAAPRAVEEVCTELARVFPWDRWDDLLDAIREGRALVSPLVDRATLASYEIKGQSAFWLDREDLRLEHALLLDAVERLRAREPSTLAR